MRFVADLHVHSRYSRATSREADLEGYYRWARLKGVNVIGTGDFTHPRWLAELSEKLVEKDGLFELKEPPRLPALEGVEPADIPVRFILTVEISSIYKKHGETRKVHTVLGVPSLDDARRLGARLAAIGNIASDGRPILGLDPKDLLSILLETAPEGFLIPAHVWTPWFSLFGSKSGFDSIEECFEELTPHIFALETGLSSDPPMNWRWSALDRFRLVSNSDAHSPPNLGREANLLDTEISWSGVTGALRTGHGFLGTFEFYPEEGKYHFDGHRKCGVCMDPSEAIQSAGRCPTCGAPLTIGVLHRVLELADRADEREARDARPRDAYRYLIPVPELLSELTGAGVGSRAVEALQGRVVRAFGSEYGFLFEAGLDDISKTLGPLIAEAVRRMREGRVDPKPGYDGEFGVIRVFDDDELERLRGQDRLFAAEALVGRRTGPRVKRSLVSAAAPRTRDTGGPQSHELDDDQKAIVGSGAVRIVVSAGPGTGKTRLLTQWLADVVSGAAAMRTQTQALALTFTNRAAEEMRGRLSSLLGDRAGQVTASTFHSFAFAVLRSRFPALVTVYNASQRQLLLSLLPGGAPAHPARVADRIERIYEGIEDPDAGMRELLASYEALLLDMGGADVSSLVTQALRLLMAEPALLTEIQGKYPVIAVDELQDINKPQFELLSLLCGPAAKVFAIGDPDQAIYGFRGSRRELFFEFRSHAGASAFNLVRNYRSTGTIVRAADALIAPSRSPDVPRLASTRPDGPAISVFHASDPEEEAGYIASVVLDCVGGIDSVSVDAARGRSSGKYSFSDIAVLSRTRAVRDALIPALSRAGLPVTLRDNVPLAQEEPFRSLVAALRLVVNPRDLVSLRELETGAQARVLERRDSLAALAAEKGIEALVDEVSSSLVPLDRTIPAVALGSEAIRETARDCGADLPAFLTRIALLARESEGGRVVEKVQLLTFHAAKGLEFPVVVIAGVEDGIVPLGDDPAEERRLFYVALTRAREALYITHCARRVVHGSLMEARPSPFLLEIPAQLTQAASRPRQRRDTQLTLFG